MYRINLYPAGVEKKVARSIRLRHLALLALVLGVQTFLLGHFILSGLNLQTQSESVERTVASNKRQLLKPGEARAFAAVNQARLLLRRRIERRDWFPVLAELSRLVPDRMILERIEASTDPSGGASTARMRLTGRLLTGRDVEPVVDFARRLSSSSVYREEFMDARVDRVDTSEDVARFSIICPLRDQTTAEPPPAAGGFAR